MPAADTSDLSHIRSLTVYLHGVRIGVIHRLVGDRQLYAFDQDYVDDPDRDTLSLSFKGQSGQLVTVPRPFSARVPPFFSNLLPEGHLRSYLADRAGVKPGREFFLLAALGADLPGAVTVQPDDAEYDEQFPGRDQPAADTRQQADAPLRFSLAGVQMKFSAVSETAGGLTIPADGWGGSWIVKLPSMRFTAVPENEFVMLTLARAIGISVPDIHLVETHQIAGLPSDVGRLEGKCLAIERFDRSLDHKRIHTEDFAQVFGLFPNDKYRHRSYANLAAVLRAEAGEEDTDEFVRRIVFSVLIGNADMHLKNWSLLYPDRRTPTLSPAYDLVSTVPYLPDDKLALTLGGERNLQRITPDQMRRFSDAAGLPMSPIWETVCRTVEDTYAAWQRLYERALLPADIETRIDRHLEMVVYSFTGENNS